jgi:hypothetical protein
MDMAAPDMPHAKIAEFCKRNHIRKPSLFKLDGIVSRENGGRA